MVARSFVDKFKGWFTWGPKIHVPSLLRSICAISAVESIEDGTYHFTQGLEFSYVP